MRTTSLVALCAIWTALTVVPVAAFADPAAPPTPASKPVQTAQTVYWVIANTPDAVARCQSSGGTVSTNPQGETICTRPSSKLHRRWTK